jgi:hypothetical protein
MAGDERHGGPRPLSHLWKGHRLFAKRGATPWHVPRDEQFHFGPRSPVYVHQMGPISSLQRKRRPDPAPPGHPLQADYRISRELALSRTPFMARHVKAALLEETRASRWELGESAGGAQITTPSLGTQGLRPIVIIGFGILHVHVRPSVGSGAAWSHPPLHPSGGRDCGVAPAGLGHP